jgi:hypothetical protein
VGDSLHGCRCIGWGLDQSGCCLHRAGDRRRDGSKKRSHLYERKIPLADGNVLRGLGPLRVGQTLTVANKGADSHTFIEVAAFGGGVVPVLNGVKDDGPFVGVPDPLTVAPECAKITPSDVLAPGQAAAVTPASGTHKFQCCIHPWMRAVVGVGN